MMNWRKETTESNQLSQCTYAGYGIIGELSLFSTYYVYNLFRYSFSPYVTFSTVKQWITRDFRVRWNIIRFFCVPFYFIFFYVVWLCGYVSCCYCYCSYCCYCFCFSWLRCVSLCEIHSGAPSLIVYKSSPITT